MPWQEAWSIEFELNFIIIIIVTKGKEKRERGKRGKAGHFGEVQLGFLQLLLTPTWVKCTSLDSSRCVVYFGVRFNAI